MGKLSLALNNVVAHHYKDSPIETVEVCFAALGLLTAYLERVPNPGKRRALAACFCDITRASGEMACTQRRIRRPIKRRQA